MTSANGSPAGSEQFVRRLQPNSSAVPWYAMSAYMTEWNPTTRESVVTTGAQDFTNLPMINPTLLGIGPVTLLVGPGRPLILGRVFEANPPGGT
jgi:hypothetical protein